MRISIWVMLTVGVIIGVLPIAVSAVPITDADVSIDFIIDDGDSGDLHDENGWLVAGSDITSTVHVACAGDEPVDIHYVRFSSLEKDTYGNVSEGYVSAAPYDTVFSASGNVAGNAPILVEINYSVNGIGYDYNRTEYQRIDHNVPMKIQNLDFESEVTLDSAMDITMSMEDAYGNTVNSLYEDYLRDSGDSGVSGVTAETVTFSTTSYAGSGFYDDDTGYDAESVKVPVNAEGSVVAAFKVGTEAGPKYLIHLVPCIALDDKWLTITALADGEPYAIAVSVDPNVDTPPYQPADGESKFYLTYNLYDRYGNPSGNQTMYFNDSVFEDEFTRRTNSDGEVKFTFGPFDQVTLFNIHAYAVENTSVTVDQQLRFTNTSPEEMLLTANPQSMPSADVAPLFKAQILAKVMDESGNGVPGEAVDFNLIHPEKYSNSTMEKPTIDATKAWTDEDGIATVNFTPGVFADYKDETNYSATASENCTVVATWGMKSGSIKLEWRNYPYLRVETEVNPETVEVGDPVDVTIRLIGDGYALYPDPIDVMLCADRSGSMDFDTPTRMTSLKKALKLFNGKMTEGTDRVGMVSFGGKGKHGYTNYAEKDLALGPLDHAKLNTTIDSLVSYHGTPLRGGLYESIKEMVDKKSTADPNAVRAVIMLTDGDYNWYGDPLARGTGYSDDKPTLYGDLTDNYQNFSLSNENQNMSVYAKNNDITIYSIAFGTLKSQSNKNGISPEAISTLKALATSTGGTYDHATTGEELAGIYTKIAGELKTEAGVDTTMDVIFENIELNNVSVENDPQDPILEYEHEEGESTLIKSWNTTISPPGSEDKPNVMGPRTLDQRNDWRDNRSLNFNISDIGTIHLGQTWQAKFRLNVSKAGNINIFGEGSLLSFNNGADSLSLPKTYITAVPDLNATGINFTGLEVYDLTCSEKEDGSVIENYLTMNWNLNYSGTYTATQNLYYQKEGGGILTKFCEVNVTEPVSELAQTRQLYVGDFPPGIYKLRVHAKAEDTPDSIVEAPYDIEIGTGGNNYIRLE